MVAEAVAAVAVPLPAAAPAVTSLSSLCLQKEEALLKKVVDCPRTDVGVAGVAAVLQLAEQELAEKDSTLSLMLTDEAHLLVGCHAMKASNMYVPTFGPGTCSTHTEAHATHTHTPHSMHGRREYLDEDVEIDDGDGSALWLVITDAGGGLVGFATYGIEVPLPNGHS